MVLKYLLLVLALVVGILLSRGKLGEGRGDDLVISPSTCSNWRCSSSRGKLGEGRIGVV